MTRLITFYESLTMYRFILGTLLMGAILSFFLSLLQLLPFSFQQLIISLFVVCAVSFLSNKLFYRIFRAIENHESSLISALILFFVLAPPVNTNDIVIIVLGSIIAMASKFLIAVNAKHCTNPVAIATLLLGILGFGNAIWWAGSAVLLPFFAFFGFLLVTKIRRWDMVAACVFSALIVFSLTRLQQGIAIPDSIKQLFLSWPLIFFATIMLTEPLTTPGRMRYRILYGMIVGVLFVSDFSFGPIFSSPEFALVIGNIVSYLTGSKTKLLFIVRKPSCIADGIYEISIPKDKKFHFIPGQYMEWTLEDVPYDMRGNRRFFSFASSPTESEIKIAMKIPKEKMSMFKKMLLDTSRIRRMSGDHVAGDFLLPDDQTKKLVFIAGGIGITPFRSMMKYLLDVNQQRDIILFYFARSEKEFAYKDVFEDAHFRINMRVVYSITGSDLPQNWSGEKGKLTGEMIMKHCFDYKERLFYVSGPNSMVRQTIREIRLIGVSRFAIRTDYFPGY
ncbi:MAG: oxidoreductase [Patescibacteria group bacterium]|nr:oxidoreductase [Patescibacteria group bacterium]